MVRSTVHEFLQGFDGHEPAVGEPDVGIVEGACQPLVVLRIEGVDEIAGGLEGGCFAHRLLGIPIQK
jgi:hypothetical protein